MKLDWNVVWRIVRNIILVILAEIEKGNNALVVGADPSAWWTPETLGWMLQALALVDALRTALPPLWAAFLVFWDAMQRAADNARPQPTPPPAPLPDPDRDVDFFRAPANDRPALRPEDWD